MTSSVTSTTGAPTTDTASTPKPASNSALDREAFLKLLVAQISHQDPLQPMQGTEFVAQLSQFAIVEQSVQQSSKLDALSAQMGGLANNEATTLVGKSVTVRGRGIAFDGITATGASVSLAGPATKVTATIKDSEGRVVRTIELGGKPAGALSVSWDGRDDSGQKVARGAYTLDVQASTASGDSVGVSQNVTGLVTKVSFDKGYPEVTLDSGSVAPISDLVSVGIAPEAR